IRLGPHGSGLRRCAFWTGPVRRGFGVRDIRHHRDATAHRRLTSALMPVLIRSLEDIGAAAWDTFVVGHPDGTFFHRAAWSSVIEKAFGHRTHYVCAERDGAVTGVLPLARVKTLLFGDTLISVPFCVYGGPLAVEPESAAALSRHAETLLSKTGASAVEF